MCSWTVPAGDLAGAGNRVSSHYIQHPSHANPPRCSIDDAPTRAVRGKRVRSDVQPVDDGREAWAWRGPDPRPGRLTAEQEQRRREDSVFRPWTAADLARLAEPPRSGDRVSGDGDAQ
jgi:hypothetical protein